MIYVGIVGYGTIGSGVYEVLGTNKDYIAKRAGEEVAVKYICDLRDFPGDPAEKLITHDFNDIVNDPEVKVVVETMGGLHPAYEFVKKALESGKSVCSSNKELVAEYGAELLALAKSKNLNFLFEASVGGGIPIIRPLNQALTSDEIVEIRGILNGTTNYILTKMSKEGESFEEALKGAQDLGYAERNPEADVEGFDPCRKIAILTSLAYGKQVDFEDIHTEGITKISKEDIIYAGAMNAAIKLLGSSRLENGSVYAQVSPIMVDTDHPLYGVNDVYNAIFLRGESLGEVMFYGKGAGKLPTASAVAADVVDAIKHKGTNIITIWDKEKIKLGDFGEMTNTFFVRVPAGEKEKARELFDIRREINAPAIDGEFAFLTSAMKEKDFEEKAAKLNVISRIRTAF